MATQYVKVTVIMSLEAALIRAAALKQPTLSFVIF